MTQSEISTLPSIVESKLLNANDGFWLVKNRKKRADYYVASSDSWLRDIEQVMVALIDNGTELPGICHHGRIRKDGKRLVVYWEPVLG